MLSTVVPLEESRKWKFFYSTVHAATRCQAGENTHCAGYSTALFKASVLLQQCRMHGEALKTSHQSLSRSPRSAGRMKDHLTPDMVSTAAPSVTVENDTNPQREGSDGRQYPRSSKHSRGPIRRSCDTCYMRKKKCDGDGVNRCTWVSLMSSLCV